MALASGIAQGEQFLAWCDEALELLSTVELKEGRGEG